MGLMVGCAALPLRGLMRMTGDQAHQYKHRSGPSEDVDLTKVPLIRHAS